MQLDKIVQLVKLLSDEKESNLENDFWQVGKAYFIRTVTMHLIGEIKAISGSEILLKNASWVADSGRFHDALKNGDLKEVEPFVDDVILNRDCIVDATIWKHKIPDVQK